MNEFVDMIVTYSVFLLYCVVYDNAWIISLFDSLFSMRWKQSLKNWKKNWKLVALHCKRRK